MKLTQSERLYHRATRLMPGGVNSPVRSFRSVKMDPIFIREAKGSKITDADGNQYIDYVGSWGPMILGHAREEVIEAIKKAAEAGVSYGTCIEQEIILAELVREFFPSMELLRMVNSGTEATMSAIRAARAYTGKDKIIKLIGCYHGHADHLLVKAGSGATTLSSPDSSGIPEDFSKHTLLAPYNDSEAVRRLFDEFDGEIAAVILEPIAGNMGFILPDTGFLQQIRSSCDRAGALLIYDEVMTGFRVSKGGAQELFREVPDLTCLGKVIGGGLPVGCYGGRRDVMECVSPLGKMYQAGTLSGNPLAMSAGIETLKILQDDSVYEQLGRSTAWLVEEFKKAAKKHFVPFQANFACSMFGFFFKETPVKNYEDALSSNVNFFGTFFKQMISRGIYIAPSAFEAGFMSLAHSEEDLQKTAEAFEVAIQETFLYEKG